MIKRSGSATCGLKRTFARSRGKVAIAHAIATAPAEILQKTERGYDQFGFFSVEQEVECIRPILRFGEQVAFSISSAAQADQWCCASDQCVEEPALPTPIFPRHRTHNTNRPNSRPAKIG